MSTQQLVLGLFPNTRGYGYALFESPTEVIDCGTSIIRPLQNANILRRITKFIDYYEPHIIILRGGTKHSSRVTQLISKIKSVADKRVIDVTSYTREDIRSVFTQFNATTKYEIAKTIITWLPRFAGKLPTARKPWKSENFNMAMFDAISLVLTHYYLDD